VGNNFISFAKLAGFDRLLLLLLVTDGTRVDGTVDEETVEDDTEEVDKEEEESTLSVREETATGTESSILRSDAYVVSRDISIRVSSVNDDIDDKGIVGVELLFTFVREEDDKEEDEEDTVASMDCSPSARGLLVVTIGTVNGRGVS
jgi:hypothetical protein